MIGCEQFKIVRSCEHSVVKVLYNCQTELKKIVDNCNIERDIETVVSKPSEIL